MKENYYIYNNEAITSCIILSILDKLKSINVARVCLLLPLLLDDRLVSRLIKNNVINIESFIREEPRLFLSFDKRFNALLPVLINSIILLEQCNSISIATNNISILNNININFIEGNRFKKIEVAIPKLLTILENYSTEQLYLIFKVQL